MRQDITGVREQAASGREVCPGKGNGEKHRKADRRKPESSGKFETNQETGKSNSKHQTFTWKTNFGIANVTSFKVNGSTTATSGTAITGDPGATGEYTYDATIVVPKNETIKARSATLEIKGEGSTVLKTITITQALGDSYLYLNSQGTTTATVTIPKGGGEQTLSVLSNDEWTFEPAE